MGRWLTLIAGAFLGLVACSGPASLDLLAGSEAGQRDGMDAGVPDILEGRELLWADLIDPADGATSANPDASAPTK